MELMTCMYIHIHVCFPGFVMTKQQWLQQLMLVLEEYSLSVTMKAL
jgi:hypothetical protein